MRFDRHHPLKWAIASLKKKPPYILNLAVPKDINPEVTCSPEVITVSNSLFVAYLDNNFLPIAPVHWLLFSMWQRVPPEYVLLAIEHPKL